MATYFVRSGYGYLKGGFATIGLIAGLGGVVLGGVTLAGGSTLIGALMITAGGSGTINSIFSLIDVKGWLEMKKTIDQLDEVRKKYEQLLTEFAQERVAIGEERKKFGEENEKLAETADKFEGTSDKLEQENIKLKETVAQYHLQLKKIQKIAEERDEEMKKIVKEREELSHVTEEQKENLKRAYENNEKYEIELATQKEIRKRLEDQVNRIEGLSKDYEEQNIMYKTMIEKDKERIANGERMIKSLEIHMNKYKLMYEHMNEMVKVIAEQDSELKTTLSENIDKLNQAVDNIDDAVDNMIDATKKMTNTFKNRTIDDFRRFDLDHDGKLSQYEFLKAMGVEVEDMDFDEHGNVNIDAMTTDQLLRASQTIQTKKIQLEEQSYSTTSSDTEGT